MRPTQGTLSKDFLHSELLSATNVPQDEAVIRKADTTSGKTAL